MFCIFVLFFVRSLHIFVHRQIYIFSEESFCDVSFCHSIFYFLGRIKKSSVVINCCTLNGTEDKKRSAAKEGKHEQHKNVCFSFPRKEIST
jgi:hypothetical protein